MRPNTLVEALEDACRRGGHRTAVVTDDRTLSYAHLDDAIYALAAHYVTLGVRPGDRILCQLPNRPEHLVAAFAAWRCGAVHVSLHHESTAFELTAAVKVVEPVLVVHEPTRDQRAGADGIRSLQHECPWVRILLVGEGAAPSGCLRMPPIPVRMCGPARAAWTPTAPEPADPAAIFLTSGSTGVPKMPLGFHGRLAASWTGLASQLAFCPDDVHLAHLPLAHGFGLMLATAGLLGGGRLILVERFSPDAILDRIGTSHVSVLHGAAAHFRMLLSRRDRTRHNVASLRIGVASASAFSPSLLRSIRDELGMDLLVMYGSSEGVGVATRDPQDYLIGSVGRPAPHSVAIVDMDRKPCPTGAAGEIAFSRKIFPVQYWRGPGNGTSEAQAERVDSGWYYSGDLGRLDHEGRLFVLGRLKHQINRGGSKVDPIEVETAVLSYPGVVDAAVIGVPHPVLGESVCACVVVSTGHTVSLPALRTALADRLAPYKLPEQLHLVDRLPRTVLDKVDVEQLRSDVTTVSIPVAG